MTNLYNKVCINANTCVCDDPDTDLILQGGADCTPQPPPTLVLYRSFAATCPAVGPCSWPFNQSPDVKYNAWIAICQNLDSQSPQNPHFVNITCIRP